MTCALGNWRIRLVVSCLLFCGLSACMDDSCPESDTGVNTDGSMVDAGQLDSATEDALVEDSSVGGDSVDAPVAEGPVLSAFSADGTEGVADFSCLGTRSAPESGEPATLAGPLLAFGEFRDGAPVRVTEASLQVFVSNEPSADGSCGEGCQDVSPTPEGIFVIEVPSAGWFAYRSLSGDAFMDTVEQYSMAPVGEEPLFFNTMRKRTLEGLAALGDGTVESGTSLLAGRLVDCTGQQFIKGARLEIRALDGTEAVLRETSATLYFNEAGTGPDFSGERTNRDGRYVLTNLPPADGEVLVELWGRVTEGLPEQLIACEPARVFADGMTNLRVGPLRGDGHPSCLR